MSEWLTMRSEPPELYLCIGRLQGQVDSLLGRERFGRAWNSYTRVLSIRRVYCGS